MRRPAEYSPAGKGKSAGEYLRALVQELREGSLRYTDDEPGWRYATLMLNSEDRTADRVEQIAAEGERVKRELDAEIARLREQIKFVQPDLEALDAEVTCLRGKLFAAEKNAQVLREQVQVREVWPAEAAERLHELELRLKSRNILVKEIHAAFEKLPFHLGRVEAGETLGGAVARVLRTLFAQVQGLHNAEARAERLNQELTTAEAAKIAQLQAELVETNRERVRAVNQWLSEASSKSGLRAAIQRLLDDTRFWLSQDRKEVLHDRLTAILHDGR